MLKLAMEWLKYAKTAEAQEAAKTTVFNAEPAFMLLRMLLKDRRSAIPVLTEEDYKHGDWASLQAHRNGRIQEIDHLLQLITFKDR